MNKIIVTGRLCKDIELKYTANNIAVTNNTIAVERKFDREKVDFLNIVVWNKSAEFMSKYLSKGKKVIITGRLEVRVWQDNDNNNRYQHEIIVEDLEPADSFRQQEQQQEPQQTEPIIYHDDDDSLPF